jgi:hypothetical protein
MHGDDITSVICNQTGFKLCVVEYFAMSIICYFVFASNLILLVPYGTMKKTISDKLFLVPISFLAIRTKAK